jgi:hypothetical protein
MEMISYPASALTQFADEELVIEAGAVLDPDLVKRRQGENGHRLWVEGVAGEAAADEAFRRFRVLLGVVRTWNPLAGELVVEREAALGSGPARDGSGNQTIHVGTARVYVRIPGDLEGFAQQTRDAMIRHGRLRQALGVYGNANRNAADYFNIGELCAADFGRQSIAVSDVAEWLAIPLDELRLFVWSANNRSATGGGRHALQARIDRPPVPGAGVWSLEEMRDFVGRVLRSWIQR